MQDLTQERSYQAEKPKDDDITAPDGTNGLFRTHASGASLVTRKIAVDGSIRIIAQTVGGHVTQMESLRYSVGRSPQVQDKHESATSEVPVVRGLVERAARGDAEAFGEIYGMYMDPIYRYVFYQVGNRATAEDLTEEVFIKAWRGIPKYRFRERPFSAWLYRIAHNHVVDYFRTSHQAQSLDEVKLADSGEPASQLENRQLQEMLSSAISDLTEQQKQIVVLKFVEEMDNREIEQVTGKSQGAIRVMQMRALAALRDRLSKELDKCELSCLTH